jgi:hypothetical protein
MGRRRQQDTTQDESASSNMVYGGNVAYDDTVVEAIV